MILEFQELLHLLIVVLLLIIILTNRLSLNNVFPQYFKYSGVLINGHNSIEEEIKARIVAGNRAFCANKIFLQNKILSRESKIKIYNTLIKPIVLYASKLWVLTKTD